MKTLVIPKKLCKKIEGKSIVSFVIDKESAITDLKVIKKLSSGCYEATMNTVLASKHTKWSPALNTEGKPVKVRKILPIDFKLPKIEDKK